MGNFAGEGPLKIKLDVDALRKKLEETKVIVIKPERGAPDEPTIAWERPADDAPPSSPIRYVRVVLRADADGKREAVVERASERDAMKVLKWGRVGFPGTSEENLVRVVELLGGKVADLSEDSAYWNMLFDEERKDTEDLRHTLSRYEKEMAVIDNVLHTAHVPSVNPDLMGDMSATKGAGVLWLATQLREKTAELDIIGKALESCEAPSVVPSAPGEMHSMSKGAKVHWLGQRMKKLEELGTALDGALGALDHPSVCPSYGEWPANSQGAIIHWAAEQLRERKAKAERYYQDTLKLRAENEELAARCTRLEAQYTEMAKLAQHRGAILDKVKETFDTAGVPKLVPGDNGAETNFVEHRARHVVEDLDELNRAANLLTDAGVPVQVEAQVEAGGPAQPGQRTNDEGQRVFWLIQQYQKANAMLAQLRKVDDVLKQFTRDAHLGSQWMATCRLDATGQRFSGESDIEARANAFAVWAEKAPKTKTAAFRLELTPKETALRHRDEAYELTTLLPSGSSIIFQTANDKGAVPLLDYLLNSKGLMLVVTDAGGQVLHDDAVRFVNGDDFPIF